MNKNPFGTMNTVGLPPIPPKTPVQYFGSKATVGGTIGLIAAVVGMAAAGAVGDKVEPGMRQAIGGAATAVTAGILSGIWNWMKHKWFS